MGKLLFPSSSSSLVFSIFLLCVTKLATSQSPLLSTFCHNRVQDPNFCLKALGSDPRSQTATSVHDLETLAIDLGLKFIKAVTIKWSSLLENEKDPDMRIALGSCAGPYSLVKSSFDSMREAFQSGRPMNQQGADARTAVAKCDQGFDQKKLTSPLAQDDNNLLDFIQIIIGNGV